MICRAETIDTEALKPTNILPQTPFWARLKKDQGFQHQSFHCSFSKELMDPQLDSQQVTYDDILVLLKDLGDGYCFAYVPFGPKKEPVFENHGLMLETLSESIRPYLPSNCIFIRYDLQWENQWAEEDELYDEEGNWTGPPPAQTQEFRVNFNTHEWNLRKSPGDLLPKNTFFLDLKHEQDALLYKMRYNTRYNIKKAQKEDIQVKEYGQEKLDDWYALYAETAARHQMGLQDQAFFESLFAQQDNDPQGVQVRLLMADDGNDFLSSMFLVLSHQRANYLYGASTPHKKHTMASYALQWEAIKLAKNYGCEQYDMFGCAPNTYRSHPLHGVHIYKKGFGGELHHRMGCWDYPFEAKTYELIKMMEMQN